MRETMIELVGPGELELSRPRFRWSLVSSIHLSTLISKQSPTSTPGREDIISSMPEASSAGPSSRPADADLTLW